MTEYDWSQFHVRMYYLAPLEEVFRRFSTAEGLESFFIHKATHAAADGTQRALGEQVQAGDHYDWTYVHDLGHGDVIVELAGKTIENIYDYTHAIEALKIGEPVKMVVLRAGKRVTLDVTPGSRE